jgi:predicted dinucleotide-binding enzyme
MKVGIIGAGDFGKAAATRLVAGGHEVMISNSRGPESLAVLAQQLGPNVHAGTAEQAAGYGSLTIVAVPTGRIDSLPFAALSGRTVIDANNYYPSRDGPIDELDSERTSSSEMLAARLRESRVVKAFNTIWYGHLLHESKPRDAPGRLGIPIAGDHDDAKLTVARLIGDMGFDAVDGGKLADGQRQQPGTSVFNIPLTAVQIRQTLGLS